MKKPLHKIALLIMISVYHFAYSQNLIPNPSFEEYTSCPSSACQIHRAIGWKSFSASPNYFNACASGSFSIPDNALGFQYAATGNAYVSAYCGTDSINLPNLREYFGINLLSPLVPGITYFVSFATVLIDLSNEFCGCAKLGALFTTYDAVIDSIQACNGVIGLSPRDFANIYTNNIISDTSNWTTVSGTFVADSVYEYIVIGNHFTDSLTPYDTNFSYGCSCHYLFDDILVVPDSVSGIYETKSETIFHEFKVYPNPASNILHVSIIDINILPVKLKFYNLLGDVIKKEVRLTSEVQTISISGINPGIYFLSMETDNYIKFQKLIINH